MNFHFHPFSTNCVNLNLKVYIPSNFIPLASDVNKTNGIEGQSEIHVN